MFEALPESRDDGSVIGRRAAAIAVCAHVMVLAGLIGTSVLAWIDPGVDPPVPWESRIIVITEVARLGDNPEAGGPSRHEKRSSAAPAPAREEARLRQPASVPDADRPVEPLQPATPPADSGSLEPPGPAGYDGPTGHGPGVGPGDQDGTYGVPSGKEDGVGPEGVDSEAPLDEPLIIGGRVEPPVLIQRIEPEYPEMARRVRVQGMVILEAIVGVDGRVESVRTLKSVPLLDEAAKRAVGGWVYRPARYNGRPVKVFITITVEFKLR